MPPLLQLQKLPGKGDGGWKKVSLCRFFADQKIAEFVKRMRLGTSYWVIQAGLLTPLTIYPASLKPLGRFYFWCVLSSQWKAVTVNLRSLHCQL